jgi:hypothetical protein
MLGIDENCAARWPRRRHHKLRAARSVNLNIFSGKSTWKKCCKWKKSGFENCDDDFCSPDFNFQQNPSQH